MRGLELTGPDRHAVAYDNLKGQGGRPDTLVGNTAFAVLNDKSGSCTVDGVFVFAAEWIDVA